MNVLITGVENNIWDLDPSINRSCKWCHEVLIPVPDDNTKLFCQGCGSKYPITSTSTSSNDNNSSITQPDRRDKYRRRLGFEDETDEDLGALNYFSKLYGITE